MFDPSSPSDPACEWHALLGGQRRGPFSREALRRLLDAHPDGWAAPVWRLGMLDWRAASSVAALSAAAPPSEPPLMGPGSPLEGPPRVSAARNTAGELRVLSYEELHASGRALRLEPAPPVSAPMQRLPGAAEGRAVTGEWAMVGTSELSAIGSGELRAWSPSDPGAAETGAWAAVGTSELRVVNTAELRALVLEPAGAGKTVHELPALSGSASPAAALPSMIVREQTVPELPSFEWHAQSESAQRVADAPPRAHQQATPTPRTLPVHGASSGSARASRAPLFVMAGLLVLSAVAFGSVLTMRSFRAYEVQLRKERAYGHAPPPPQPALQPSAAALADASQGAATQPSEAEGTDAFGPHAPDGASREGPLPARSEGRSPPTGSTSRHVRVRVAEAPVRVGNHRGAALACALHRGSVRAVLTELPGADGRWLAVRCDDQTVGWVNERDVARLQP